MSLHCQEISRGRLALSGELDISHASEAKAAVCDVVGRYEEASVDLSGVTEIDFIGVQILLAATREAEAQHHHLALENSSPAVAEAFELLGVGADPVREGTTHES